MRVWLATLLVAGCYDPHVPIGAPCSPMLACPAPLVCSGVACIAPGAEPADAIAIDTDAFVPFDAPTDDAVPDAPRPPSDAAPVPWVLVQTADIEDMPSLDFGAATQPGSLLVVGLETDLASPTSITDDSGDAFTQVAGSQAADHAQGTGLEVWVAPAIRGGAHKLAVSVQGGHTVYSIAVWEVANLKATAPIDAVAVLSDQAATTAPAGATVQTTQRGDFVVGIAIVANVVSGLTNNSLFTNDLNTHGNGWAHMTSASAVAGMYHPRWNQPTSGTSCATSVALFAAAP